MDHLTLIEPVGALGPFERLKLIKSRVDVLPLADGRNIRLLSDTSYQLTTSSGKHIQYGSVQEIEYEPHLINEYRKQLPLRSAK